VFAYGVVEQSHSASKPYCPRTELFSDYTLAAGRIAVRAARPGL